MKNQRVQIAQMPLIIGIDSTNQKFIRWSAMEAESCSFVTMTSCRETPAIRKESIDSCLIQILSDKPLTSCLIEPHPDPIFVQRLGVYWIISTNTSTQCHEVKMSETGNVQVGPITEINIPPVALITTKETTSLSCDHFFLPGQPIHIGQSISIIENTTIQSIDSQIYDLNIKLSNNTKWEKLLYIPSHIQTIIDYISQTESPTTITKHSTSHSPTQLYITIFLAVAFCVTLAVMFFLTRKKNAKTNNLTITLPHLKPLDEIQMLDMN